MAITREDVNHVASLARLALTEEEAELFTGQLKRILGYVEKLSEIDTSGIDPTFHTTQRGKALREDRVTGSIPRDEALGNAPESERGCFKVPKIIE